MVRVVDEASEVSYEKASPSNKQYINSNVACFCNQESDKTGWYSTTFGSFNYHLRPADVGNDALLELERQGSQTICKDYMLSSLTHDHFDVVACLAIMLTNLLYVKLFIDCHDQPWDGCLSSLAIL